MATIATLLDAPNNSTLNYQLPVKVTVIKRSTITNYQNQKAEHRKLYHLALADEHNVIKATCYNEELYPQTKENNGLLIRNYIIKNKSIVITKQTIVTRIRPITIPPSIVQEATNILDPSPPPSSPIKTAKTASLRTLLTVTGTVQEIQQTRTIPILGQPTNIRTITLQDSSDNVKVSLWRHTADSVFTLGDYIRITNVNIGNFNGETILNSTKSSTVTISTAPTETLEIEIIGLEMTSDTFYTITTQLLDSTVFQSMHINTNILLDFLFIDHDAPDIEDTIVNNLPFKCEVLFCKNKILQINKPLPD